jgi:hypothetical protein
MTNAPIPPILPPGFRCANDGPNGFLVTRKGVSIGTLPTADDAVRHISGILIAAGAARITHTPRPRRFTLSRHHASRRSVTPC